jgi:hypothetical protein
MFLTFFFYLGTRQDTTGSCTGKVEYRKAVRLPAVICSGSAELSLGRLSARKRDLQPPPHAHVWDATAIAP